MTPATKARLWRYGSLGLFLGVPLLLLALAMSNLIEASQARAMAARQQGVLAQLVAQANRRGARSLTPAETASLFLASTSNSLARAELQERATKLVGQAGGRLKEAQFTATPEQEADGTVAIQLSLDVDNKGLLDLLYAVETSVPLLTVSDLSARTNDGQNEDRPSGNGLLHVDMTVQGHWRKAAG